MRNHRGRHRNLSKTLKTLGVDKLFSSPYIRAQQTIAPFAQANGHEIFTLENLHERMLAPKPLSDWQSHIKRSFQDRDHAPPGGESLNDTFLRAQLALTDILKFDRNRAAAVSHGNLIASVLHHIDPAFGFDSWKAMTNPDLFKIDFENGHPSRFARL